MHCGCNAVARDLARAHTPIDPECLAATIVALSVLVCQMLSKWYPHKQCVPTRHVLGHAGLPKGDSTIEYPRVGNGIVVVPVTLAFQLFEVQCRHELLVKSPCRSHRPTNVPWLVPKVSIGECWKLWIGTVCANWQKQIDDQTVPAKASTRGCPWIGSA